MTIGCYSPFMTAPYLDQPGGWFQAYETVQQRAIVYGLRPVRFALDEKVGLVLPSDRRINQIDRFR